MVKNKNSVGGNIIHGGKDCEGVKKNGENNDCDIDKIGDGR